MSFVPSKHQAVVIVQPRAPLEILEVDTIQPAEGEIVVRVIWFASTPLNLHNADGGTLVKPPHIMSGCFAGEVALLGDLSSHPQDLHVGDKVFGFAFAESKQRPMQEYITIPAYFCGKVPEGLSLQAAATVPSNFVTAVHTVTKDLGLELPWPVPQGWAPSEEVRDAPILVWGAASSVGQYALQVLKFWGYRNVLAVASRRHHDTLRGFGAAVCFDYTQQDVVQQILSKEADIPYIIDCIGSLEGTLTPLSKIAGHGSKVAVMLPVIVTHASSTQVPEYEMDVGKVLEGGWKEGVEVRGVRTHFYTENEFFKDHLQPNVMPELLARGLIQPNKQKIVEGATLLERAEKALALLRERDVSGEKLVWRVADE
ncbi:hypothetical protein N0V93_001368 [Gnomoniopsis smithogilvyi]|uniref:Enoyl reductase (ER) domain-containing protein n=1 Tax=Gnomoniopsis smithogilvyi TaxID=1191159 RepID=A0A9W9D259_9PEZI|nr:hypothetical protein N0V93_001368 [Gnomoniopsis smithogilvyi]